MYIEDVPDFEIRLNYIREWGCKWGHHSRSCGKATTSHGSH